MSSNEGSELQNDRNEACTLKCENGSTCSFKGPSLWGQKDGMHCVCTTGFAGVRCELSASVCGAGEHVCLNGSACVKDGNEYKCECEQNDASFNICPHRRTEFCTPVPPHIEYYDGMAVAAFCVNDGICADVLIRNQVCVVSKLITSLECIILLNLFIAPYT